MGLVREPASDSAAGALPQSDRRFTHRDVLIVAVPIMLSNATTPLIGFVDAGVVGQLGAAHLIGAVAVAANIFSLVYWAFGFLRMGTTGLTAQALGAGNRSEIAANVYRAGLIAVTAGCTLVVLQWPIATLALAMAGASGEVDAGARTYIEIRIWSAPAALLNFALLGWFIGLGRAGLAFLIQLLLNGVNVALSFLFVMGLKLSVAGVGYAALTAEVLAAGVGIMLAQRELARLEARASRAEVLDLERLKRVLAVNGDIMIRTLGALLAFFFFAAQGARSGDVTLAANALLQSTAAICVYLLDGFAFAAEALVGQAIGASSLSRFREAVRLSTIWAAGVGLILSAILWLAGPTTLLLLTTSAEVRAEALTYLPWAALTPILGVWCFQLDGIFIGATRTADMRNMMLVSVCIFLGAWALLAPAYGNHGLWAAVSIFYVARAATLLARYPVLVREVFWRAAT